MQPSSTSNENLEPPPAGAGSGISVVVTVRNDRDDLAALLPTLAVQSRAPDEVVVVDGGSTDGTLELLAAWSTERFPVRIIEAPDSNISEGRNVGISAAANEWIACTDAGCRATPGWLAAIDEARGDTDFIAGVYLVEGETPLERLLAVTNYPVEEEMDESGGLVRASHRLFGRGFAARDATGRSMAFSRSVWQAVGGFPTHLYAGEDVYFSRRAVEAGFRARVVSAAGVRWRPQATWTANAHMYFYYARGDVREASPLRPLVRGAAWSAGPIMLGCGSRAARTLGLLGMGTYIALPMARAHRRGIPPRHWWRIPLIAAAKDLSMLAGVAAGLADGRRSRSQPRPAR